jgi:hypothetical protein
METLIFAIIATYNVQRQQERVVAEPVKFRPFDLEALTNPADNMPSRSWSRLEVYVAQTA